VDLQKLFMERHGVVLESLGYCNDAWDELKYLI
jgi:hypothetical protein